MSSSSGAEGTVTSPAEQQANSPVVTAMATASMDPRLLALVSSASSEKLQTLLDSQASGYSSTDRELTTWRASSYGDTEANESILDGVTAEGDTALHVAVTASAYCNGEDFLESARVIYRKAKHLLFVQNNKGDTPLHCAARAGKSNMVACLIDLADAEGEGRMKDLLRKENKHKETALNEAVRVGNKDTVDLLMGKDSELASFPEDGGASPMYLAIVLQREEIVKTLYDKSRHGKLSFSGPNGQNALHAAVHRYQAPDNDGNTALHLAVKNGNLRIVSSLLANSQVNLNLQNNRGETPLDISGYKLPELVFYNFKRIETQIHLTLRQVGAVMGVRRQNHLLEADNKTPRVNAAAFDESKETQVLKDSTGALCIGSVLISTVTFGVTFAVPGGYIADDHNNGGSPILAPRQAFHAFMWSNALAFTFSTAATVALMRSGNPMFSLWSRKANLNFAATLVSVSITCLAAAFALAAYVVLDPVAPRTAGSIAMFIFLVLLYNQLEFISIRLLLLPTLCSRKGIIQACLFSALNIMGAMLLQLWPLIYIFCLTTSSKEPPKIEAPAPAPLAST